SEALLRVLTNLLDNAIRHARTRVDLTTQRANGTVSVHVRDDGPRFTEEDLPHVFEPLFRSDRARADSAHHSGAGLGTAGRLVRAHGCDGHAANAADGGPRVTIDPPAIR